MIERGKIQCIDCIRTISVCGALNPVQRGLIRGSLQWARSEKHARYVSRTNKPETIIFSENDLLPIETLKTITVTMVIKRNVVMKSRS